MRLFKKLRRKLDYLPEAQIERVQAAYLLAFDAHRDQKRVTGEAYITHPVAVACILADIKMDAETIMAALLHDVIEDTHINRGILLAEFGEQVANIVDGVSKLTQIEFVSRAEAQAENFRKMVLAMAQDIRVIIVKLSDRLHNMRTLGSLRFDKQHRIAKETLEIFAPIAKRLGMRDLSVELEELGFMALYPRRYAVLKEAVRRARGNRKKILAVINKSLQEGIAKSSLSSCVITGREKHLYSIYRKMRNKKIPFNEIMDVYAFRIIVDDIDKCYRVLGIAHQIFKPVPERFKDYIAIPKANGYQSLHTTLFGPYGLPIEVQIRTTDMDRMATSGIAAHWLYKSSDEDYRQSQLRAQQWVRNLLEIQQSSSDSLEFIENVKIDLFPDEVYVFTPNGDIMELPAGATAIDFAYTVHTDIGNQCVAIKIDRQLAPLSTRLVNGQTIEVVTAKRGRPNPMWLDIAITSKARSAIRHFLKNQRQVEAVSLGSELLQKALSGYSLNLEKIQPEIFDKLLVEIQLENLDALYVDIGLGERAAVLVAKRISDLISDQQSPNKADELKSEHPLVIKGTEGMVMSFAECCCPLPGDPIIGIISVGQGISVHVESCHQLVKARQHPERCITLRWAEDIKAEFVRYVRLEVVNQRGVLAVMALAVSDADGNIDDIKVEDRDGKYYQVTFKLLLHNRKHLAAVMRNLRQVPQVIRILR
ncbi:MAG: RelA/SpoT family protein [Gammaproteobacteria bacterium]|nr:RelA/SpoT family protein [Gammaproteobacteria bacterium]